MSLRSWFRGTSAAPSPTAATSPKSSADPTPSTSASASTSNTGLSGPGHSPALSPWDREVADLVDAMEATSMILNDDIDGAEARLRPRTASSSFHMLGLGVATFMRSVIGFEKDAIAEAAKRLADCETQAAADQKKAQRDAAANGANKTQQYPPGTEYALVHAEAQMLQAVLAVLHESLTDAVRGFYKLRKAFVTLNAIMDLDDAVLRKHGRLPLAVAGGGVRPLSYADDRMPGAFDSTEFADLEAEAKAAAAQADGASSPNTPSLRPASSTSSIVVVEKNVDVPAEVAAAASTHSLAAPSQAGSDAAAPSPTKPATAADADFLTNPVDVFVHSGASMCFGILLLIISMVPPAFSRLLSIVGFKGDGERGQRMLWNSTQFANINGGMAGLVLLTYYNSLVGMSDIIPRDADIAALAGPDEFVGYPKARLEALLAHMRTLYPNSALWKLEEARMLEANRRPREAVTLLEQTTVGRIKQVAALIKFQMGLEAMSLLDWPLMRDSFLKCIELNDWSHALYYYNAGCAELELFRTAHHAAETIRPHDSDEHRAAVARAQKHRMAAETLLRKAPPAAGKKKFMARQMPFDVFGLRRVARWEERATALGVSLAKAIDGSPAQEMLYLWVGSKRMSEDLLSDALNCLDSDSWYTLRENAKPEVNTPTDEAAIVGLCRASLLRAQGQLASAQTELDKVMKHDKSVFKGPTDYVLPAAHYEAAVICWEEAGDASKHLPWGTEPTDESAVEAFRRKKIEACETHLETAAKWDAYTLDARIGRRVQTGLDSVQWLKKKMGWP